MQQLSNSERLVHSLVVVVQFTMFFLDILQTVGKKSGPHCSLHMFSAAYINWNVGHCAEVTFLSASTKSWGSITHSVLSRYLE